eukprot:2275682-Rhodomonas_salina.1
MGRSASDAASTQLISTFFLSKQNFFLAMLASNARRVSRDTDSCLCGLMRVLCPAAAAVCCLCSGSGCAHCQWQPASDSESECARASHAGCHAESDSDSQAVNSQASKIFTASRFKELLAAQATVVRAVPGILIESACHVLRGMY